MAEAGDPGEAVVCLSLEAEEVETTDDPVAPVFSVVWVLDVLALVPAGEAGALVVLGGGDAVVAARAGALAGVDLPLLPVLVEGAATAVEPLGATTPAVSGPGVVFDGLETLAGSRGTVSLARSAVA